MYGVGGCEVDVFCWCFVDEVVNFVVDFCCIVCLLGGLCDCGSGFGDVGFVVFELV